MHNIMKTIFYLFAFVGIMSFSSCNDWLNVTPKGQVEAEDLYRTTKGCNSAIGGIYYTLSSKELFGKELSYGAIDMLAQYWDFSNKTSHKYYSVSTYDFKNAQTTSYFYNIWHELYYAITQCNAFIHYSEPNKESIDNYNLLLGEAYGLRALAHLELFEIYGPVIHTTADLQKSSIAYRTAYNNIPQPFDSGETVLNKAESDLKQALALLENDPMRDASIGRKGDANTSSLNYQDVLNYRGARMNYFCVLGLLTRLEMLRQNKEQAYQYATRIIEESKGILSLVDKSNIMGNDGMRQYNYCSEMLGAFYVNDLFDTTNEIFGMGGKSTSSNDMLLIDANQRELWLNNLYNREPDGSGTDNRYIYWFVQNQEGNTNYDFTKLRTPTKVINMDPAYYPEVSIMRLSEVYYIACETQIGKDNALALKYLNQVRTTRNLPDIEGDLSDETLLEYLVREARKDLIGDGRMFFMYKRLFRDIYAKQGMIIAADDSRYVVPIPDDEYEFTGIEKPADKN